MSRILHAAWAAIVALFWRHPDWRSASGNRMRRWHEGNWQYRPMTDDERSEDWLNRQW